MPASRHNGVHFFISSAARWLRSRRFSEPTFRPSGATNLWKNVFFSSLLFSSLTLLTSAFLSVHIAGSLTSKLHSIVISSGIFNSLPKSQDLSWANLANLAGCVFTFQGLRRRIEAPTRDKAPLTVATSMGLSLRPNSASIQIRPSTAHNTVYCSSNKPGPHLFSDVPPWKEA